MEKVVVVSSNNNPDYRFYEPYVVRAWHNYGWKVAVMLTHDCEPIDNGADYYISIPNVEGLRLETQAQASRLYAANHLPEALLMTSDMDLIPLKDYWKPQHDRITNYGHDLTGFSFFPMGYTAMSTENWRKVMNLTGDTKADMLRDAHDPTVKYSPFAGDWETWWNYDWSLLTNRLTPYDQRGELQKVLRGNRSGTSFALGRVDRGDSMQIPNEELIDAHCENHNVKHPDKLNKFINLFEKYHGKL